jgi:FkbM family methyltransferase
VAARTLRIILRTLIAVVPIVTAALIFHTPIGIAYEYAQGKAGTCSLPEAWHGARETTLQIERTDALILKSAVLRSGGDGTDLWGTPDGEWWVPTGSGNAILYDLAEQDRDIYRAGADGVRAGDVILDCGANVGVFTKRALARGAARVIAIEPAPENLRCLRKNFASEIAAGKVVIYEKGVWDKEETLTMHIDPKNSASNSFVSQLPNTTDLLLPVTTIDKLVDELRLARVDFIKMDIEGAERHAIAGAAGTIRRFRPRMALCIYHLDDDPKVIPGAVLAIRSDYKIATGCLRAVPGPFGQVAHFR